MMSHSIMAFPFVVVYCVTSFRLLPFSPNLYNSIAETSLFRELKIERTLVST